MGRTAKHISHFMKMPNIFHPRSSLCRQQHCEKDAHTGAAVPRQTGRWQWQICGNMWAFGILMASNNNVLQWTNGKLELPLWATMNYKTTKMWRIGIGCYCCYGISSSMPSYGLWLLMRAQMPAAVVHVPKRGSMDKRSCLLDVLLPNLNIISLELAPIQRDFDRPVTLITHVGTFLSSSSIILTCCMPDPSLALCMANPSLLLLPYCRTFWLTLATFPFLQLAVFPAVREAPPEPAPACAPPVTSLHQQVWVPHYYLWRAQSTELRF